MYRAIAYKSRAEYRFSSPSACLNGTFNGAKAGGRDFGDSVLKLRLEGQRFLVIDGAIQSGNSDIEMVLNWPSLLPLDSGVFAQLSTQLHAVVLSREGPGEPN